MASRIEIELTSRKDDDEWTWRAAGAREPRGTVDASLLPDGAAVGDVLRAEAEFEIDGIYVTSVQQKDEKREAKGFETLELLGSGDDGPLVTQTLAPGRPRRGDRPRRRRDGDRREGRDRGEGGRERSDRDAGREGKPRGKGKGGPKAGGRDQRRPPAKPKLPPKPRPPKLKAGRAHQKALLDELAPEKRPIADQLLKGGMPGVRQELTRQNEQLRKENKPEMPVEATLKLAEELLPRVRRAEFRDRAEAALEQAATVDIRDLRAVVTAAQSATRGGTDDDRALAAQLRDKLNERIEADHAEWLGEIASMLDDGRVVRALHLSSRPPKAGSPLPGDLATRLIEQASASLNAETGQDRWGYTLEALAHSPVRRQVVPQSLPTDVGDDLTKIIARLGDRLPDIAHIFGITPDRKPARGRTKAAKPKAKAAKKAAPGDRSEAGEPKAKEPKAEQPTAGQPQADEPAAEQPKADEPATEQPKADEPAAEAEPSTEQPHAEERPTERPKAEAESSTEQPRAEAEPSSGEPTADEPTTGEAGAGETGEERGSAEAG